jgi:hypothetical protein
MYLEFEKPKVKIIFEKQEKFHNLPLSELKNKN